LSKISLEGNASGTGTFTIASPNSNTNRTLTLPDSTGTVVVSGTTPSFNGIAFPATQSASADANTLDDYEEGSFTPTVTFGGASAGITYNASFTGATYTKIGNRVCVSGYLVLTDKGSSTGAASIGNLPFTSASGNTRYLGASIGGGGFTFANQFFAWIPPSATIIQMGEVTEAGTRTDLTNSDFTNSTDIFFTAHYTV